MIYFLRREDVAIFLWPLPVGSFHGIGPKTAARLEALGIRTIGDLARADPLALSPFGRHGQRMLRLAQGDDDSLLPEESGPVSLSHEETFAHDIASPQELHPYLVAICDRVAERLRRSGHVAGGVALRLRSRSFRDFSRQAALPAPSARAEDLRHAAADLLARMPRTAFPCRLLGVTAQKLEERQAAPPELFPDDDAARRDQLWQAVSEVRRRFGSDAVRPLGAEGSARQRGPSGRKGQS